MRIGVNTIPLYPGQIGGMEKYTVNLLTHLTAIDRQHRYYLFVARYNRALFDSQFQRANVFRVQTLSLQGLRYSKRAAARLAAFMGRRLPCLSRWLVNAVASAQMMYSIRRHRIDLWFCPLINLVPRHVRLPSVVSLPDLQPEFYPDFFPRDLLEWLRRRDPASCRDATKVIALSEFSRATIIERYGLRPEKVHTIGLAVSDESRLPPEDSAVDAVKATSALPAEYAFYPANTWPHKNDPTLLKALHRLKTKYRTRLSCVFQDMPLLYRGARFLVFPSLFEGFGLPLLEAMASDCPVLCSSAGSLPEVVGDAALLFDPNDPEEMADSMHRILTDEELRRTRVKTGRERALQFSWERTARETLKVLEEAASIGTHPSHTHR